VSKHDLLKHQLLIQRSTDYPAYELYTDVLQKGIFKETGKQLRLIVDKHRKVEQVEMQ
jgi:hypothetical protein